MNRLWTSLYLLIPLLFSATLPAQTPGPFWLSVRGTLDPITRTYLIDTIHDAEADHRPFVVLELDIAEGSQTEAQRVVEAISLAKIPIAFYLPSYASLGTAGGAILFTADFAAASPLSLLGEVGLTPMESLAGNGTSTPSASPSESSASAEVETKIPDWFSTIQRIAQSRGRHVPPDPQSIGFPFPVSAQEFNNGGYLDGLAPNRTEFHRRLGDSKTPAFRNENPLLIEVAPPPSLLLRLAHPFCEPNSAYFLFSTLFFIFLTGLSIHASVRRNLICLGCLAIAILILHTQLLNYSSLLLVLAGGFIALLEHRLPFFGLLGMTGSALFFLGSFLLVSDPEVPHPSLSVILPAAALLMCLSMIRTPKNVVKFH